VAHAPWPLRPRMGRRIGRLNPPQRGEEIIRGKNRSSPA